MLLLLASPVFAYPLYNMHSGNDRSYKEMMSNNYYYPNDKVVVTKTSAAYYENDDRPSTYDYRWGYSYRTSNEYWNRQYSTDNKRVVVSNGPRYNNPMMGQYNEYNNDYYDGKMMQWEYNSYRDRYESRTCYDSPPKGKLFYIKCN